MLHDYLHCLVFKEQSCLALLSKCLSLQATHLSYHQQFSLSRTFLNSFLKLFGTFQCLASQGFATPFRVRVCQRLVLYYTSRSDMSTLFLKKCKKSPANAGKSLFQPNHSRLHNFPCPRVLAEMCGQFYLNLLKNP